MKYLLVAVDCFSRYLRVETLKSKYATTTADAFRKIIKNNRPKKMWVDAGTEFKGSFSTLCQENKIEVYKIFSEKKISICGKKYTIAQEFNVQVFSGQMTIIIY